jgi:hypothetical protein
MKVGGEGQCVGDGDDVLSLQCKELKQEIGLMKQQLDMALVEIWNLKIKCLCHGYFCCSSLMCWCSNRLVSGINVEENGL